MSPAEQLRAAAAKIRDTAAKATPGPWALLSYQVAGVYDEATDIVTDVAFTNGNRSNATWIALMSPVVAEPLADLLECAARSREAAERGAAFVSDESVTITAEQIDSITVPAALALARAILGEAP